PPRAPPPSIGRNRPCRGLTTIIPGTAAPAARSRRAVTRGEGLLDRLATARAQRHDKSTPRNRRTRGVTPTASRSPAPDDSEWSSLFAQQTPGFIGAGRGTGLALSTRSPTAALVARRETAEAGL